MKRLPSLSLFFWNQRGFSFEVEDFNGTGYLKSIGPTPRRGKFQPDPDVAGVGIISSMIAQAIAVCLLALWTLYLKKRNSKIWLESFTGFLFSVSDMSSILSLAYIINFMLTGKCKMSTYHYYIVLDTVLLACSTIALTFHSCRHVFFSTRGWILRVPVALLIFSLLGIFLSYQFFVHTKNNFPEWVPPVGRNDSGLLLPVSCFFDMDLMNGKENPFSPHRAIKKPGKPGKKKSKPVYVHEPLTETQLSRQLGHPIQNYKIPHFYLYGLLTLSLILGIAFNIWQHFVVDRRAKASKTTPKERRGLRRYARWAVRFLVYGISILCTVFCTVHILKLRSWAEHSGWLSDESESRWYSLGQLLPPMALGISLFMLLDSWGERGRRVKGGGLNMSQKGSKELGGYRHV
ncbi:hypothetical protein HYFRA_00008003 [Hymenoscyphus fraxineus]|uniref:Uncharacterized protein n=1 Tax=Hymenoscyphus fraxineus TaxID=746836 RepID=A0A9N9KSC9_9HELO|nr:hypothetical protein HYFRA_00008003 [Hymenoscyphus fraxineus]